MLSKTIRSHLKQIKSAALPSQQIIMRNAFFFGVLTPGKSRQEKDTFGPIEVPGDKYWGA
jgi:hypothetical protein